MKTLTQAQFFRQLDRHCRRNFIPKGGSFELTPLCNLDCKMCYIHLNEPGLREKLLSGEQWIGIMRQAVSRGMMNALVTGGEAMTHPDFKKIYLYLKSQGVMVTVKTNGLLLNDENIRFFADARPSALDISLYGCDRESYIAVTGHDVFEQMDRNIRAAAAAGLPVRLMIVPSSYMSPWTDRVLEWAKGYGVPVKLNGLLMEPRENTHRKKADFDLTNDEIIRLQNRKNELFPEDIPVMQEIEEETEPSVVPDSGLKCSAGRSSFAVHWTGILVPCLEYPEELFRADVLAEGFDAAWEKAGQEARDLKAPEQCGTCEYRQECNYCPMKHYPASLHNACLPSVCEYMKYLIDSEKAKSGK